MEIVIQAYDGESRFIVRKGNVRLEWDFPKVAVTKAGSRRRRTPVRLRQPPECELQPAWFLGGADSDRYARETRPPKKSKSAKASAAATPAEGTPAPAATPKPVAQLPPSLPEQFSFAETPRPFKNLNYRQATARRKTKGVKLMLQAERDRELAEIVKLKAKKSDAMEVDGEESKPKDDDIGFICYSTLEAPPSLIPAKKYCDVTGLDAAYTDPQTGLRYHDKDIFAHVRTLKPATVQAFLTLRGGGQPVIV